MFANAVSIAQGFTKLLVGRSTGKTAVEHTGVTSQTRE